jgi:hypothetical protein
MRYLKQATVVRSFVRRGWHWNKEQESFTSEDANPGPRIFGRFNGLQLMLYDARLIGHSNVHLVSYWGPFLSLRELEETLVKIEDLYSRHCGTRFRG